MIVLSGDIGGTNTRLQLTEFDQQYQATVLAAERYKNAEHTHLHDIIAEFLSAHPSNEIHTAGFAIAGAVIKGEVKLTNLPWQLSESELAKTLSLQRVAFINDFEAIGYGILTLRPQDCHTLQKGKPDTNRIKAIVGAGTGLGMALLQPGEPTSYVIPTEGGHVDFAATDSDQMGLLQHLKQKLHRVSCERIVSGSGMNNIYKYVRNKPEYANMEHPELQRKSMFSKEFAAEIAHYAQQERDPICLHTLDLFIRCYGAVAGNLALTTLPFGGLYITGGIAPKLLPLMQDGRFMKALTDKGRMSDLLKDIPVHIVLNTDIGLTGAAYYAAHL